MLMEIKVPKNVFLDFDRLFCCFQTFQKKAQTTQKHALTVIVNYCTVSTNIVLIQSSKNALGTEMSEHSNE